jgi:hypothetical protein
MSIPNTIPCLLYFAALFLTVATLWILLYASEGSSPQDFFVLIIAVMPFVMLNYFGLAVIICDKISAAKRLADRVALAAILRGGPGCGSYLCRPNGVAMVAMAQAENPSKRDTAMRRGALRRG